MMLHKEDTMSIEELYQQGMSQAAIALKLGINRKTVGRYLRSVERKPLYGP